MKRSIAGAVLTMLLSATVVACSDDKPEVCNSVDDLKSSIDGLTNIDVSSSTTINELQSGLDTVQTNLTTVKTDAKAEFSSQIDAVDTALGTLNTSVDTARSDPTANSLAAVGTAVTAFTTATQTLVDDVESTC